MPGSRGRFGRVEVAVLALLIQLWACGVAAGEQSAKDINEQLLLDAAATGKTQQVEKLLAAGASPNYVNEFGESSVHLAAISGSTDVLKALINAKADLNTVTLGGTMGFSSEEKRTPLMWFADSCQVDGVRILLDAGADANVPNEAGKTVLDMMANHDSTACKSVEELLKERGALDWQALSAANEAKAEL